MPPFLHKNNHFLRHHYRNLFEGGIWKEKRGVFVNENGGDEGNVETPLERPLFEEMLEGLIPIENEDNLEDAIKQFGRYDDLIKRLSEKDINGNDLVVLMESALFKHFPEELKSRIIIASELMHGKLDIVELLRKPDRELRELLDEEWKTHQEEVGQKIAALKREKKKIGPKSNRSITKIDSEIKLLRNEAGKKGEWIKERMREMRRMPNWVFSSSADPVIFHDTGKIIEHAKYARQKQIGDYLLGQTEVLINTAQELEGTGFLEDDEKRRRLENLKNRLANVDQIDAEELRSIKKEMNWIEVELNLEDAIQTKTAQPEKIEETKIEITNATKKLIESIQGLTESKIKKVKDIFDSSNPDKSTHPQIHQNRLGDFDFFATKTARDTLTEELRGDLNRLNEMTPQELADFKSKLFPLMGMAKEFEKIADADEKMFESPQDRCLRNAEMARLTIEAINEAKKRGIKSIEELKEILNKNLPNRVDWVTPETFNHYPPPDGKDNLSEYSKAGMVFYERGGEFKIIINEDHEAFRDKFPKLLRAVEHELGHAVFENDKITRERFIKKLEATKQWHKIESAFKEMVNEPPVEKPPTTQGWTTEAIASEIYAMNSYTGLKEINVSRRKNPAAVKFNNLIFSIKQAGHNLDGNPLATKSPAEQARIFGHKDIDDDSDGSAGAGGTGKDPSPRGASTSTEGIKLYKSSDVYQNDINAIKEGIEKAKNINAQHGGGMDKRINEVEKYNNSTQEFNNALREKDNRMIASVVDEQVELAKARINEINQFLTNIAKNAEDNRSGGIRQYLLNTKWISIEGFAEAFKMGQEYFNRRRENAKARQAGKVLQVGAPGTGLAGHGASVIQQKEQEEVGEWDKGHEQMDIWQLQAEVAALAKKNSPDKFRFKSLIRMLAKKGGLSWRDKNIWKILNKLQSTVYFSESNRALVEEPDVLRAYCKKAIGDIYDKDEFLSLERSHSSAYESKKNEQNNMNDTMYRQLSTMMDSMIKRKRAGENVDGAELESMLQYCIQNGKSFTENIVFHFITGIAEGIIEPDRHTNLNKFSGKLPILDWLAGLNPNQADFKKLAKKHFPNAFKAGSIQGAAGRDFFRFYYSIAGNDPQHLSRVSASAGEDTWDHDLGRAISPFANAKEIALYLQGRGGKTLARATAIPNLIAGQLQWMELNAEAEDMGEVDDTTSHFVRHLAAMAMIEGIGTKSYRKGDPFTRYDNLDEPPREGGYTLHPGWKTQQHLDKIRSFMNAVDNTFFGALRDESMDAKEKYEFVTTHLKRYYPESKDILKRCTKMDEIYDNIEEITTIIVNQMGANRFKQIIKQNLLPQR